MRFMKPYLPAALLAVFSLAAGTLPGAATFGGAAVGLVALWLIVPLALPDWRDPLALGSRARILLPVLVGVVILSWLLSPVRRAGIFGVAVLPMWLLLPAAIANCWPTARARRQGLWSISGVVLTVAVWSLVSRFGLGAARAAMPIGHHTALAVWLVLTWPLVWALVTPAVRGGAPAWSTHPASRVPWSTSVRPWAASSIAGLALVSLVATGSLTGMLVALLQAIALLAMRSRHSGPTSSAAADGRMGGRLPGWIAVSGAAAALLVWQGRRLGALVRGLDSSGQARLSYLEGGLRGWGERPWLGWGPGSVPWTAAEFLRPRPGVNPAGEIVGDLHSLPVQWAYEIGALGLLAAVLVGGLFLLRRGRELRGRRAGLVALGGGVLSALSHSGLTVTALPLAAAVAAGFCLATGRDRPQASPGDLRWPRRALWAYRLGIPLVLVPLLAAQYHYDRAVVAGSGRQAFVAIDRAASLDPTFPLYRARRAWLLTASSATASEIAEQSLAAAREARGLSVLWLAAGTRGVAAGEPWAPRALAHACRLDPLAAMAPFLLAITPLAAEGEGQAPTRSDPRRRLLEVGEAADAAVRAVLADPRLAAATSWSRRPGVALAAVERLRRWPAVPSRWRTAMSKAWLATFADAEAAGTEGEDDAGVRYLGLEIDRQAALSWSLHAFKRRPWPTRLVQVPLRTASLDRIRLAPAAGLSASGIEAFEVGCLEADVRSTDPGGWP